MAYIKLLSDKQGSYRFGYFNENESIGILGLFLTSDVRCSKDGVSFFKEWALNDQWMVVSGNITRLEKDSNYILLSDLYPDEEYAGPIELRIKKTEFIKVLDIWFNKICKEKPKEITITEKDGEFSIETKD
jgi:hypothetical protein